MKLQDRLKPVLLIWILLISLIGVGTVFAVTGGLVEKIHSVDFTYISFLIGAVFWVMSIRTGILTYKAATILTNWEQERITESNELGWFFSDCFTYAGMIGTVIGFIVMMQTGFDSVSAANLQQIIVSALSKMGLALFTTAAGLICSLLLKLQLFNLEQYLKRFKPIKRSSHYIEQV